jgi:hypothetical protein
MEITPPFGYDEVVQLEKTHRVLLPAGNTPSFCRTLSALAVSLSEFVVARRDYPIIFLAGDGGKSFTPVIVLGLSERGNLFVNASGEWDPSVYFPAYVRRFPFCLSKFYADGKAKSDLVVCVAKSYVDKGGLELFDAAGAPTPRWQEIERLLLGFEADLDRTAQMCAAIARLDLMEPFALQAGGKAGIKLAGMHRVSEARLHELKPASLKALAEKGFLGLLYAHLHSLDNFNRLLARQQRAGGKG